MKRKLAELIPLVGLMEAMEDDCIWYFGVVLIVQVIYLIVAVISIIHFIAQFYGVGIWER